MCFFCASKKCALADEWNCQEELMAPLRVFQRVACFCVCRESECGHTLNQSTGLFFFFLHISLILLSWGEKIDCNFYVRCAVAPSILDQYRIQQRCRYPQLAEVSDSPRCFEDKRLTEAAALELRRGWSFWPLERWVYCPKGQRFHHGYDVQAKWIGIKGDQILKMMPLLLVMSARKQNGKLCCRECIVDIL